jgi:hypothetical protein
MGKGREWGIGNREWVERFSRRAEVVGGKRQERLAALLL